MVISGQHDDPPGLRSSHDDDAAVALVFCLRLSLTLAAGMAITVAAMLAIFPYVASVQPGLLVIAWIGPLVGHKIEGRKRAFS